MLDFEPRLTEQDIANKISFIKGSVNYLKNQLDESISFSIKITQDEVTRLSLTTEQQNEIAEFVSTITDLHNYITNLGF
jgi:hypothetical protein